MSIYVIGINHKTAPIHLREQAYFALDQLPLYLQDLLSRKYCREAVLLSTCNRSELYAETDEVDVLIEWFAKQSKIEAETLKPFLYVHHQDKAIMHMMRVASGLDSMVLGETQILGQMKEAFSESCTAGAVNALFHRLFQQVFAVAKDIRTTTAVGACPVSLASAAFQFAKTACLQFAESNIVLLGASDTNALLLRYLHTQTNKTITIVNRSIENAIELAEKFHAKASPLTDLREVLLQADIVFSATSSPTPIVNKEMIAARKKSLLFIDLAVPRDIDPDVLDIPSVSLYCIDDLKSIIEKNRQGREHAASKAEEMIAKKSLELLSDIQSFDKVSDTIRAYRNQIENLCQQELLKAKQQLHQGKEANVVLDAFAHALIKKLLHTPSIKLRQAAAEGSLDLLQFAKQLFAISDHDIERL